MAVSDKSDGNIKGFGCTFVDPGHRASVGSLGTPDHYPVPGTSGQRHLGIELGPDRQLVHIQLGEVEVGRGQAGNSGPEAGWDQLVARLLHSRHAVAPLRPCANSLLLSCVASILYEFP